MCVYMHHLHIHAPPITTKYKIYLVDLPFVLYERSGQNETSVLNQLFFVAFRCFSCAFDESTTFYTRSATFHENQQNQVNMCLYMHYLHIYAPPNTTNYHQNIRYTWLTFPLYYLKYQVKMRHLCWISCFVAFRCFSYAFDESTTFYTRSATFHENHQNQVNMCVYMHYLHIHAPPNTTKYHQHIRYTLLAFPLYSLKDQVKMRHLCWISCFVAFQVLFMCFS